MSLLDDIRKDRDAGTDGPWFFHRDELLHERHPHGSYTTIGSFDQDDTGNAWQTDEANARRIARVTQMEAALLAADELAKASENFILNLTQGDFTSTTRESRYEAALTAYRTAIGDV